MIDLEKSTKRTAGKRRDHARRRHHYYVVFARLGIYNVSVN
jgi:hypothetical protein